jgi:hypothetical protein
MLPRTKIHGSPVKSRAETSKDSDTSKGEVSVLRGAMFHVEGPERIVDTRLPFRLTQKLITREDVGLFFVSSKQKYTWICGWGSQNLVVLCYDSGRSGRKQVFINGLLVHEARMKKRTYRYETAVHDDRPGSTQRSLAVVLLIDRKHASLWLDGFNVKSLRRGSLYEKGSPPPPVRVPVRVTRILE